MQKRGYHDFPSKFFVSHCRKISLEQFGVSENLGYRTNFLHSGILQFSVEFFFVSQYQKTSYENPSVFQKISGTEKFYA